MSAAGLSPGTDGPIPTDRSPVESFLLPAGSIHLAASFWAGEAPAERSVVLCHGLCACADEFADLPRALADRRTDVLSFDYSGHGRSPGPRGLVSSASHARETLAAVKWLRTRSIAPPLLLGHSFGAHAVLRASASELSTHIRGVVTVSAPLRSGDALPLWKRRVMRWAGLALRTAGPLVPGLRLSIGHRAPEAVDIRTLAYAATLDNVAAARRVPPTHAVLVVRGGQDREVTSAAAASLLQAFPSPRKSLLEVDGTGHSPFRGTAATTVAAAIAALAP